MSEHYCVEHGVPFFKKGKMPGYAHPIGDTGKWCNEEESEPKAESPKPTPKSNPEMTKEDWAVKERATRKSIERQKSLELAVRIGEMHPEKATIKAIIEASQVLEYYLETGEIKSILVKEAKKMGAVEEPLKSK